MWLLIAVTLMGLFYPIHAYHNGARNESCFDHRVNHGAEAFTYNCDTDPSSCPYFLRIREVLDVTNLTMNTNNTAENITCGNHIYTIEVAHTWYHPNGFLVQARNGTTNSSEIVGTFLSPTEVNLRNLSTEVYYQTLQCPISRHSHARMLQNSATHLDNGNKTSTLLLFWKSPGCDEYNQNFVYFRFTIVESLLTIYSSMEAVHLPYFGLRMSTSVNKTINATASVTTEAPQSTEQQHSQGLTDEEKILSAILVGIIIIVLIILCSD